MTVRVAINGYGRIGRNILRSHYEGNKRHDLAIVPINDLGPVETNAHLTRYDTTHRKFPGRVEVDGDHMVVNADRIKVLAHRDPAPLPRKNLGVHTQLESTRYGTTHRKFPGRVEVDGDHMVVNADRIKVLAQRDPAQLPWKDLGVDVVLESTGFFTSKEKASAHLRGGAKKVIISAPGGKDVDATVVYGVNHASLKAAHTVISNASCTTNCLAPLVKPLHESIGVVTGLMATGHAYTSDQVLLDGMHEDRRRARSATQSMIPAKTRASAA